VDGEPTNDLRLTNLYVSARYRFNRNFNVLLSYDSRKRIIYYETLQTEIERLLDDDIARQGIRAYVNIRPMNNINMGFGYSKRFQSDSQNKSDNVNGYLGLTRIPVINGSIYLNFNVNSSNYLESNIISLRHSRNLIKNRLDADFYYRFASYTYPQTHGDLKQNYYGANLNLTISRGLLLNVSGELSTYNDERNYRIYTKLIKRFYPKRRRDYEN